MFPSTANSFPGNMHAILADHGNIPEHLTMTDPQLIQTLASGSPAVLMVFAIVMLWRQIAQKDAESKLRGDVRDQRIATLENAHDKHADQYRDLAEKVATVVGQTKDVMERVLEKLK